MALWLQWQHPLSGPHRVKPSEVRFALLLRHPWYEQSHPQCPHSNEVIEYVLPRGPATFESRGHDDDHRCCWNAALDAWYIAALGWVDWSRVYDNEHAI